MSRPWWTRSARFLSLPCFPQSWQHLQVHGALGRADRDLSIQSRWVAVTVTFQGRFLQQKSSCMQGWTGCGVVCGGSRHLRLRTRRRHPCTVLDLRPGGSLGKVGRGSLADAVSGVRACTAPSAEGRQGNTGPAPFRVLPGGPAQQLLSRAAAPPNQRPLREGSRFKQPLGGFSQIPLSPPPALPCAGHGAPNGGARAVPRHQAGE